MDFFSDADIVFFRSRNTHFNNICRNKHQCSYIPESQFVSEHDILFQMFRRFFMGHDMIPELMHIHVNIHCDRFHTVSRHIAVPVIYELLGREGIMRNCRFINDFNSICSQSLTNLADLCLQVQFFEELRLLIAV